MKTLFYNKPSACEQGEELVTKIFAIFIILNGVLIHFFCQGNLSNSYERSLRCRQSVTASNCTLAMFSVTRQDSFPLTEERKSQDAPLH